MKTPYTRTLLCAALACMSTAAMAEPMTQNRDIDIKMSNDAGALYGRGTDDTYWLNAPGGGLNQLHIANDPSLGGVFGQVTSKNISTSSTSGSFWVTTTGGRGYNDDLILMLSMTGPISSDFSVTIKSSGYQWTPSAAGVVNPVYATGAVNETFVKSDFLYGPQTAKPGPGNGWTLPFWSGQNINDAATAQSFMFIDLNVGNTSNRNSTDSGSAKIEFDISGIYDTQVSFNAYAWALVANVADSSINWTNNLNVNAAVPGQSGYSIITTAAAPVPEPEQASLMLLGLGMLGVLRRRAGKLSKAA